MQRARPQNLVAVVRRLLQEELPGGNRNDGRRDAFFGEQRARRAGDLHLGAGGQQRHLTLAALGGLQDIGAVGREVLAHVLAPVRHQLLAQFDEASLFLLTS